MPYFGSPNGLAAFAFRASWIAAMNLAGLASTCFWLAALKRAT